MWCQIGWFEKFLLDFSFQSNKINWVQVYWSIWCKILHETSNLCNYVSEDQEKLKHLNTFSFACFLLLQQLSCVLLQAAPQRPLQCHKVTRQTTEYQYTDCCRWCTLICRGACVQTFAEGKFNAYDSCVLLLVCNCCTATKKQILKTTFLFNSKQCQ